MENLRSSSESNKQRRDALMNTVEQFINRGSSVAFLKPKSTDMLREEVTNDLESAERICKAYPSANVAAVVGAENNLIAVRLERESEYHPDPQELISSLEQELGPLPTTMTIAYPDGIQFRLFDYPSNGKVVKYDLDTGIKLLHSNIYGTGLVVLEPSILDVGEVSTLDHVTNISKLPEKWVEYICTHANNDEHPSGEIVSSYAGPVDETIPALQEVSLEPVILEESKSVEMKEVTPEEYLKMSIVKMVNDNVEPCEAVANAKMICSKYKLQIDENKLAYEIFEEYKNVGNGGRYSMIGSDEAIARFICDVELEAFKDDTQMLRCRIKDTGEIVSLTSNAKPGNKVAELIIRKFLLMTNKVPKLQPLKDALRVLESHARFSTGEVKLYNRVGKHNGVVYYDIGDNTAIRITEHGWEQVTAPAIFKRTPNIKAQVLPERNGKLDKFFEFVNCNQEDKVLLATYIVSTLIPDISHPIPYIYGDHGSAKSSLTAKIKLLCDPSQDACLKLTLNNQKKEIVRNLSQYHVVVYDNVSNISGEISDVFCMASTGGGTDIRKLYTDDASSIMAFKCCPILNSVKMCIQKPDLLDRAILIRLKRLKRHRNESEINAEFQAALPGILGGMFDVLVEAMAIYPTVEIEENFRMADFAKWGFAIAEAMGSCGEKFLADYQANYLSRNEHVAQGNTLCDAVIGFMANRPEYIAEIGIAYAALKRQCGADKRDSTFPRSLSDLMSGTISLPPKPNRHVPIGPMYRMHGPTF